MKRLLYLILICALTACSTVRSTHSASGPMTVERAVGMALSTPESAPTNMTAKCSFDMTFGTTNLNMAGNLRMQRDSLIQIVVSPLGLFEAVRLEMTPSGMLVIDRMHKTFVECRYDELEFAKRNDLDFRCFQAMMWGEMFVPGVEEPTADNFTLTRSGETGVLSTRTSDLSVNFVTTLATGLLRQTNIRGKKDNQTSLNMQYAERSRLADKAQNGKETLANRTLPTTFTLSIDGIGQPARMSFSLSNIKVNTGNTIQRTQPDRDKYKRMAVSTLIDMIKL